MPGSDPQDVVAWFAQRGFMVALSDTDYAGEARRTASTRKAAARRHHIWVDLLASDGRLVQRGYGGGETPSDAMNRARERYRQEQEQGGGSPPGHRVLP